MPKPTRRRKRRSKIKSRSSSAAPPTPQSALDGAMALIRAWGSAGGKLGGKLRWQGVSKEDRSRHARMAAVTRWAQAKKTKKGT